MGLFNFGKRKDESAKPDGKPSNASTSRSKEELYGKAWLMIVGQRQKAQGLKIMKDLDAKGYSEAAVVLSMFADSQVQRRTLVKKAADAGNVEGMWEYSGFLPHSFCPDPDDEDDALWEKYCLAAAEGGSADAMNEMGNVFNRRGNFAESMYWYAMANAHGQQGGIISLKGIARKWAMAGAPYEFEPGSPKFDKARHTCAIAYLEIYAGIKQSFKMDDLIKLVLNGVPIAAYLTADIFESQENYEMAYKMYNAISFENDPHGLKCCADMLITGRGVEKDTQSAIRFYQMAAERGEREAMFVMGEFAKGTAKNMAAYWYGLAHTRGHGNALERLIQIAQYC